MAVLLDGRRVVSRTPPKKKPAALSPRLKSLTTPETTKSPVRNNVQKPSSGGSSKTVNKAGSGLPSKKPSPPPVSRKTVQSGRTYTSSKPYSGGGGSGGGGGHSHSHGSSKGSSKPTKKSYLKTDSIYQTQNAALQAALQRYQSDVRYQRANYDTDYAKANKDLGYDPKSKKWNLSDQMTASGRGYQGQLDDFAARGMLQSTGYAQEANNLLRALQQQQTSMTDARTKFRTDLDRELANYRAENTASQQAARAEAIARMAAKYSL